MSCGDFVSPGFLDQDAAKNEFNDGLLQECDLHGWNDLMRRLRISVTFRLKGCSIS